MAHDPRVPLAQHRAVHPQDDARGLIARLRRLLLLLPLRLEVPVRAERRVASARLARARCDDGSEGAR
eukprot:1953798-Prymnesium_polylepis.1